MLQKEIFVTKLLILKQYCLYIQNCFYRQHCKQLFHKLKTRLNSMYCKIKTLWHNICIKFGKPFLNTKTSKQHGQADQDSCVLTPTPVFHLGLNALHLKSEAR
jgi:hypothetical protein